MTSTANGGEGEHLDAPRRYKGIPDTAKEATMDIKIIKHSDIANCPKRSLLPQHYRDDGTCLCDDPYGHPETAPNLSISADGTTMMNPTSIEIHENIIQSRRI
jgi:hypothetical protein